MKKIVVLVLVMLIIVGCGESSKKNINENSQTNVNEEKFKNQKELYYKELESECIDIGGRKVTPDKFAVDDFNNDGELDMLAITNMSIDYYDNSYAIFTLFTIQNNKIKKVPFTTLDGLIEIIPGMDAAFHMVSNNFVVGNNYGAYKDSIELKHRKDTSIVGRNIAFDKSKTRFYVVNNKYFTIKTNDGSGRESEIFLYYGKGDELYNYRESLAELYKNPQFGGNKDDYINKWRKNTELSEEIINKFGITSDCAIWIYNNNDQTSKVSPWSFLPLYEYFLEIGENMKNNFYDTINYSKIYISENEDDNGENIKSLKRIIFYENNIDNRTKYLTK